MTVRTRRAAVLIAAASLITVATAVPALAHVTVNPSEAEQGGFTVLNFRVPNERDNASTVSLAVQFPADNPIAFVSVRPHDGWEYEVVMATLPTPVESHGTEITEAVSTITWTATDGAEINPGEYDEFSVSVGPLPEADQLIFPAVQTYSNGEVVRWIDEPVEGGEEPEFPAPVLSLTPATGEEPAADPTGETAPTVEPSDAVAQESASDPDSGASDATARWLGAAGLVAGLVAAVFAFLAWRRPTG